MGRTAVDFTGNKAIRLVHYCSKNSVLNIPSLSIEVAFSSDNSSTSDTLLPRYSSMVVSSKITIIKPLNHPLTQVNKLYKHCFTKLTKALHLHVCKK